MTLLEKILRAKHVEVNTRKKSVPQSLLETSAGFSREPLSLHAAIRSKGFGIIAEVKKASPSRGIIREDFHPADIGRAYAANGAAAISVLTDDQFFRGSLSDLTAVRHAVQIPVLRKDFVIDEYQLFEARAAGADAVLLIAAALTPQKVVRFVDVARELHLDVLLEIHDMRDFDSLPGAADCVIGVNNRNLHTFETTLDTSFGLRPLLPRGALCISESGIATADDMRRLHAAGFSGALVGERLMREPDPGAALRVLLERFTEDETQ